MCNATNYKIYIKNRRKHLGSKTMQRTLRLDIKSMNSKRKKKKDKLNLAKIKNFAQKDPVKRMKIQAVMREKYLSTTYLIKCLYVG